MNGCISLMVERLTGDAVLENHVDLGDRRERGVLAWEEQHKDCRGRNRFLGFQANCVEGCRAKIWLFDDHVHEANVFLCCSQIIDWEGLWSSDVNEIVVDSVAIRVDTHEDRFFL